MQKPQGAKLELTEPWIFSGLFLCFSRRSGAVACHHNETKEKQKDTPRDSFQSKGLLEASGRGGFAGTCFDVPLQRDQ